LTPEAATALALGAVIVLGGAAMLRRGFRWWIVIVVLLVVIMDAGVWCILTPHHVNVTSLPRFRDVIEPAYCLDGDYFLVDQSPFPPSLESAGSSSAVPMSVADYRAHPTDWSKSADYQRVYGTLPFAPQSTILAVVPAGTAVRLTKIIAEYRPATRDIICTEEVTVAGRAAEGTLLFYDLPGGKLMPGKSLKRCAG